MNALDIIILFILAFAAYLGMREGLIVQGLSIVGIAIGIWLGGKFGLDFAKMIGIKGDYVALWGFLIILFLSVMGVAIASRLIRKMLQFAGFGLPDIILGAALSVCKFLLIMSVVFTAFDYVNQIYSIVDHKMVEKSTFYRPIANITEWITPAWNWTQDQIKI